MSNLKKYRSSLIIVIAILLCVFFLSTCIGTENNNDKDQSSVSSSYSLFAGSASCITCHKEIYEKHINTAHYHTSEIATDKNIKGSFSMGENTFTYTSGGVVHMEKRGDSLYQVAFTSKGVEKIKQTFDIVTGSGTKGQTYLTWVGNSLCQLPVSYFTSAASWCNSPGMPNKVVFYRPITSRCLECHSTYAVKTSAENKEPESFDRRQMILGVDCEKCHGPAAKHVDFQTKNPSVTVAKYIINPAGFSRQQSLDLCASCHGGRLKKLKPSFEFTSGDRLSDFFMIDAAAKDANNIDVHGNQYGLLSASKCFRKSQTLTCITCHNSHEREQGKTELFSQRCRSCHSDNHSEAGTCKMAASLGNKIDKNCINCHMPELPSKAIAVLLQGQDTLTPAKMHTHFIKPYLKETEIFLAYLKNKPFKEGKNISGKIKIK